MDDDALAPLPPAPPDTAQPPPVQTCTAQELLVEQEQLEREAARVLPGDHDRCSYISGVPCDRQRVYACRTCVPLASNRVAGVCYSCSISCHTDHDLVELFTKRDFVCDCGNSSFAGFRCALTPDKTPTNPTNQYNHNFLNRYCRCDQPYDPENEEDPMYQCAVCEDWFHTRCLHQSPPADTFTALVCATCMRNKPTLARHRFRPSITAGFKEPESTSIDVEGVEIHPTSTLKRPPEHGNEEAPGAAKKARLDTNCLIGDVTAPVGDMDLFLGDGWERHLCPCELCSVSFYTELKDVRQFLDTIGREEFVSLAAADDDDEQDETAAPVVAADNVTAPPAPTRGPAEGAHSFSSSNVLAIEITPKRPPTTTVTSTYDLGLAALQSRPFHEQHIIAAAIANMVNIFKTELHQLADSGVTEVTSEHIERIKSKLQHPDPDQRP